MKTNQTLHQRKLNSIWGFIIGDCLGVPYEFSKSNKLKKLSMTGYGTHNQAPGTFSDDTSFTLAQLDVKTIDQTKEYLLKALKGEYSIDNYLFDVGSSTKNTLLGKDEQLNAGNGALMRSVPLAFLNNSDLGIDKFKEICELTHNNSISNSCCLSFSTVYTKALYDNNFDFCPKGSQGYDIQINELNNNGFVLDTFWIVLKIAQSATSYQDGILKAINLGGDTDTHAALVGSLLALKFDDWKKFKKQVKGQDIINRVLDNSIFMN